MERFTLGLENLTKDKALELYLDVCREIIEANGFKDRAFEMSKKLCDMHIESESKKDWLTSYADTWKKIKSELDILSKK